MTKCCVVPELVAAGQYRVPVVWWNRRQHENGGSQSMWIGSWLDETVNALGNLLGMVEHGVDWTE